MRKKIKNEIKEMVANSDWANVAPDNDNCTMAYLYSNEVNNTNNNEEIGIPKAILTCRPDSHPFPNRTLLLNQAVKVGRAVGKIKAASDNAIFDCKVLSRHHASLWYSNGKFYLQDTKSSNGTFVNNHRLSEGTKESPPYEVCSRDVVQFGVDVLENSNKITHGCIIATLKLYLPDGKEAIGQPRPASNVEDLCILNNILQESFQREQLLEGKLNSLRQMVMSCGSALNDAWRALCSEERLVARVQFLERRLAATSGSGQQQPNEMQQLLDDKHQFEMNAQEALQVAHQEKLKLLNQLGSMQWSMCTNEEECHILQGHVERAHQDLQELGEKKSAIETELSESKKAIVAAEKLIERMVAMLKEGKNENGFVHSEDVDSVQGKDALSEEISLPEVLKDLPKHIKAILPEQLMDLVVNKPKGPSQIKQLENKLYFLKEELYKLESIKSVDQENDNTSDHSDAEVVNTESKLENKENSEYLNSTTKNTDSEKTYIDTEGNNGYILGMNDNSQNTESELDCLLFLNKPGTEATKEMKTKLIRDKINELTEQIKKMSAEEGPTQLVVSLQKDLSVAEVKISNISKELESANSNLALSNKKLNQLVLVNNQLSNENNDLKQNFSNKAEECRKLELILSQAAPEDKEKSDEDEATKYKAKAAELQSKLETVLESEATGSKEIDKLNNIITGLQSELQGRPLSSDLEEQSRLIQTLKTHLEAKEKVVEDLNKQLSLLTEIQVSLEDKLNKASCSNGGLTVSCASVCTQCDRDVANKCVMTTGQDMGGSAEHKGPIVISSSLAAAELLDVQSSDDSSNTSVSVDLQRLTELEEELVKTKEKCARINEDKTQMSFKLQNVNEKYNKLLKRSMVDMLVYILPLVGILIYLLMYQYIS